ncbi:cytochrome c peroxidase [Stieleria varia]|uniref:Di-heme cytochrome c peroxidase n=1 Tax=Stieleria varia TaxID=2528005 RepID=A0A5C6B1D2_9BACT|nr:cytochrome c peroxidase [Stieleria varia]TWU05688.1 Di-heme cytochrome c peroxidase [Stieleria varia]
MVAPKNMMFLVVVLVIACRLLVPAQVSFAADSTDEIVTPIHLVGHEDHELLDRVQDVIDDWDPRKLVNPVFKTTDVIDSSGDAVTRHQLLRPDLAEFIADVEAANVLGKAFFWDMQAGSDFGRRDDGTFVGTACASCHYRHGADARGRHSRRFPYVVWDEYELHPEHDLDPMAFGEKQLPFPLDTVATQPYSFDTDKFGNLSFVNGSAGVEPQVFKKLDDAYQSGSPVDLSSLPNGWRSENFSIRHLERVNPQSGTPETLDRLPEWAMFIRGHNDAGQRLRQITGRNSPSVINSGFSDRLFHDGRAESTFNGYSIFGDRDHRPVLFRGVPLRDALGRIVIGTDGRPKYGKPVQVHVAIPKAALASQAVGPIVNDVEMSYVGRTFPNVACKLLDSRVLAVQTVKHDDSVLGKWAAKGLIGPNGRLTYRDLIKMAFRREWWETGTSPLLDQNGASVLDQDGNPREKENVVPLVMMGSQEEDRRARGSVMVANFSLYWGLSIMLYESTLVSNQSPFDAMMMGNPQLVNQRWEKEKQNLGTIRLDRGRHFKPELTEDPPAHETGASVFQHGLRVFLRSDCVECHGGPLFSELYERRPEDVKFPIHKLISHTLLPNSRADAIAIQLSKFRESTLNDIAEILVNETTIDKPTAIKWASELDLLREQSQGNAKNLNSRVKSRLEPLSSSDSVLTRIAQQITNKLIGFEKQFPSQLGERHFFTEKERVELAAALTAPVLVESMVLREDQVQHRRPLPIKDAFTTEPYAFYDTAFYALGVSPGRYDRGIGGRIPNEAPPEEAIQESFQQMKMLEFVSNLPQATKQDVEALDIAQQTYRRENLPQQISEYPEDVKTEFKQFREKLLAIEASAEVSVARGQAYQFPKQWGSLSEYTKEPVVDAPEDGDPAPARKCHEGPSYDPDEALWNTEFTDTSWDRDDIPESVRRSSLRFFSRARTLVVDEDPWGYRKPLLHDNELAFWGSFKTPSLRNVELTAPYMHNGRLQSLGDVIEFYDDGGFIEMDRELYPDKHPEMRELHLSNNDQKALLFFLLCLTDERVRLEQAPFDHPSLNLVNGYQDGTFAESIQSVRAVGASGWIVDGEPDPSQIPSRFPEN